MRENLELATSSFLCEEDKNTCLDDHDYTEEDDRHGVSCSCQEDAKNSYRITLCKDNRYEPLTPSEDVVREMVVKETEFLPRHDYVERLRSGDLDLGFRKDAFDWISKVLSSLSFCFPSSLASLLNPLLDHLRFHHEQAQAYYNFKPLTLCLSMNYFDRFLSVYEFPKGKAWTVQLLAVACLSLATKMEEIKVPLSVDLQVGEPRFVFEARTIKRMELLVLSTLKWRMQALTPCSYIDYFLSIFINDQSSSSSSLIQRSLQLILSTTKGIDFLELRPSEIAAGVAIAVTEEVQGVDCDKAMHSLTHAEKGKVFRCIELIKGTSGCASKGGSALSMGVPHSPIGVLEEGACFSYKSDDTETGSWVASSCKSPDTKRRKIHGYDDP